MFTVSINAIYVPAKAIFLTFAAKLPIYIGKAGLGPESRDSSIDDSALTHSPMAKTKTILEICDL